MTVQWAALTEMDFKWVRNAIVERNAVLGIVSLLGSVENSTA